jgi:hypothetical protein
MALIYALIGLGVLGIGGTSSGESVDLLVFGAGAGSMFLVLSLLLLWTDRRWVWVVAAIVQAWIFVVYVMVSGTREPPFEVWGIVLRILQVPLFAITVILAWKPTATARAPGGHA